MYSDVREKPNTAVSEVRGKPTPEKMANALIHVMMIQDETSGGLRRRIDALLALFDTHQGPDGSHLASARKMTPDQLASAFAELKSIRDSA